MSLLDASELWARAQQQSRAALSSGALEPWAADVTRLEDGGGAFEVHHLLRRAHKPTGVARTGDPFAWPWSGDLYLGDVSATHGCLLNKFPLFAQHLLFVTRAWEAQESPLTAADGDALCFGFAAGGRTLAFFNGGTGAGASQPHKHLQLVPLEAPLEPLLRAGRLPVRHALVDTPKDGQTLASTVARLLEGLGVTPGAPWNLLATREWLLVVPRRQESFEDISVNALGFAGSFAVTNEAQRERLRAVGPMDALREVAFPTPP